MPCGFSTFPLPHVGVGGIPLLALDSKGRGVGAGVGVYGFFALMAPTRSEKLSCGGALRRVGFIVLFA